MNSFDWQVVDFEVSARAQNADLLAKCYRRAGNDRAASALAHAARVYATERDVLNRELTDDDYNQRS